MRDAASPFDAPGGSVAAWSRCHGIAKASGAVAGLAGSTDRALRMLHNNEE